MLPGFLRRIRKHDGEIYRDIIELSKNDHAAGEIRPLTDGNISISKNLKWDHGSTVDEDWAKGTWGTAKVVILEKPFYYDEEGGEDSTENKKDDNPNVVPCIGDSTPNKS